MTMASHKYFGDSFRHEPRTASTTLAQLSTIRSKVDPNDVEAYFKEAKLHRLNGVDRPFWRDWALADPSNFLIPESLHHLHKFFWDHEVPWCINVLTAQEIDFRFSILQRRIGFRHFGEGIAKLKQVTGREHRNVQRHMICIIAGGAAPRNFVIALRALMDFRYLAQAPVVDDNTSNMINAALKEFHDHKVAVLEAGGRLGKKRKEIDHWYIPKLELFQSVVPSIHANAANIQWSADVTEHAHITEIKRPAEMGNNQNYEEQICRYLDRLDKVRRFDLATTIHMEGTQQARDDTPAGEAMHNESPQFPAAAPQEADGSASVSAHNMDAIRIAPKSPTRLTVNYFDEAAALIRGEDLGAPQPFRTFSAGTSAFHLNRDPSFKIMTVDAVAEAYKLPDLRHAVAHFLQKYSRGEQHIQSLGGRRPAFSALEQLPLDKIQVWTRVRIQTVSYFDLHKVLEPQTLEALPPSNELPYGRYSSILVNLDSSKNWPRSGISGEREIVIP